jgi:hypothetical protein
VSDRKLAAIEARSPLPVIERARPDGCRSCGRSHKLDVPQSPDRAKKVGGQAGPPTAFPPVEFLCLPLLEGYLLAPNTAWPLLAFGLTVQAQHAG